MESGKHRWEKKRYRPDNRKRKADVPEKEKPRPPHVFRHATHGFDPEYSADQREWLHAVDCYKRDKDRPFPSLCELLHIATGLGYHK